MGWHKFMVTSDLVKGELFLRSFFRSKDFIALTVLVACGVIACLKVLLLRWSYLHPTTQVALGGASGGQVLLWARVFRDHRRLKAALKSAQIDALIPGSTLEVALRVGANSMLILLSRLAVLCLLFAMGISFLAIQISNTSAQRRPEPAVLSNLK